MCVREQCVCGQHWTQSIFGAQTVTELCSWVSLISFIYGRTFQWSVTATSPVGLPGPCGWGGGLGFLEEGLGGLLGVVRGDGLAGGRANRLSGSGLCGRPIGLSPGGSYLGPAPPFAPCFCLAIVFDSNSATSLPITFLDKGIKLQPLHIAYQYVCCFYVLYIFNPYMV